MKPARLCQLIIAALLLTGCASSEQLSGAEYDPLESLNRGIYVGNDIFDRALLKPVAKGYGKVVPGFMRRGVTNFSANLRTPRSAINNFLQGKPKRGLSDITRFLFNSTIGVAGLFDVASAGGLEIYDEDFGQTFAVWGVPDGPYVYLPLLGPFNLRDAVALPLDIYSDPLIHYDNAPVRDKLYVLRGIDLRQRLLLAETFIEDSKDKYLTVRESYRQSREYKIYDGDPPIDDDFYDEFDEDFFDEDFEEEELGDEESGEQSGN